MEYHNIPSIDRKTALAIFESNNVEKICHALLSITFYDSDWRWVQEICLKLLASDNHNISSLAATCLGHIARIHKTLDKDRVVSALYSKINTCQENKGSIEDALEDIEIFLKE
mgnify:FL=1